MSYQEEELVNTSPFGYLHEDSVRAPDDLGPRQYIAIIGALMALGIQISLFVGSAIASLPYYWVFFCIGFIALFVAIEIVERFEQWWISILGAVFGNAGMGFMLAPWMTSPAQAWPTRLGALLSIGIVILVLVGIISPLFIRTVKAFAIAAAGTGVIGYGLNIAGLSIVPELQPLDYFFALLSLGFIVYYWSRALELPKTADNAVDTAGATYIYAAVTLLRIIEKLAEILFEQKK